VARPGEDATPEAPFVVEGSYRGRRPFRATVQRGGLEMMFSVRRWHRIPMFLMLRAQARLTGLRREAPAPPQSG
jgi:hypothetical protein